MKKIFILLTVLSLAMILTGCNGDDDNKLICDPGYHAENGQCVADEVPVTCDPGFHEENGTCVPDPVTCDPGYHEENGSCVPDALTCDPGYHEENGSCVPDALTCDPGYHEENGSCVPDVVDLEPVILGADDATITVGDSSFSLLSGVTATDDIDGDITANIDYSGFLDTANIGIYVITYVVTDSGSNTTQVVRTITVEGITECPVHHELIDNDCVRIPAEVITIMHGAVYEIDPFHEAYSGTEQLARQELQRAVEAQYNVIINYENYPASAAWGPSRVSSIIQANVAGEPMSDIYWVTSDWIQELVQGNSIVDISQYLNTVGANIPVEYQDVGEYQGGVYGFESYKPTINYGLYYNADLVESLGIMNPTDAYLNGLWNWTNFEAWVTTVQTALDGNPDEMYAIGGMPSYYATAMTTLNGGSLINKHTGRVSFSQSPALETYAFLTELYEKGVWEPAPQYDSGSTLWQTGKVALHPGSLWFLTAANRWGTLEFEIGFVPFPVADDYTDDYISPISGVAVMTVASGMTAEREQLVFTVWNALQLWKTKEETDAAFELSLITKFDKQNYIDAYLDVYDKTYLDILNAIGISAYGENGWARNINIAIRNDTARTEMDRIRPVYETALDDYLGN